VYEFRPTLLEQAGFVAILAPVYLSHCFAMLLDPSWFDFFGYLHFSLSSSTKNFTWTNPPCMDEIV
tara:strand:- start:658 stop:855 length:198 start_codon:yes stop_codon:yes gene_type:complete